MAAAEDAHALLVADRVGVPLFHREHEGVDGLAEEPFGKIDARLELPGASVNYLLEIAVKPLKLFPAPGELIVLLGEILLEQFYIISSLLK